MVNKFTGAQKIKGALISKGIKQITIARSCKCSKALVSSVIAGTRSNTKVKKTIARALGVEVSELWSEDMKDVA